MKCRSTVSNTEMLHTSWREELSARIGRCMSGWFLGQSIRNRLQSPTRNRSPINPSFFSRKQTENDLFNSHRSVEICSPYKPSLSKGSAKSGAHPSAPPKACNAVGNATNELAKERAQDIESNRDHRLRHACAAEWNMAYGTWRALAAAKLPTNWRASSLHLRLKGNLNKATSVTPQKLSDQRLSFRSALENTRRRRSLLPLAVQSIHCESAPECYVHCQLGLEEQRGTDARTSMALSS